MDVNKYIKLLEENLQERNKRRKQNYETNLSEAGIQHRMETILKPVIDPIKELKQQQTQHLQLQQTQQAQINADPIPNVTK